MRQLPALSAEVSLYPWQREALDRWVEAGFRGTMKVVTGAGKTVLGLAAMDLLLERDPDLRVAIVVPTVVLQRQWRHELSQGADGVDRTSIGLLGGGKRESFTQGRRIVIAVLSSASRYLADDAKQAGIAEHLFLIVDEAHRSGAKVMSRIYRTDRRYSLGLSATPERIEFEDESEVEDAPKGYDGSLLGRELGPIVFNLTLVEAIDQGVLPPFSINHYGVALSPAERSKYDSLSQSIKDAREQLEGLLSNRGRSTSGLIPYAQSLAQGGGPHAGVAARFIAESQERKRLLYRATARAAAVARILRQEFKANPQARALLFHESIDEVTALAKLLEPSFPGVVAIEHSKLSENRRAETIEGFRRGRVQILLSVRSLIEGFNVPAADVGIIVASSSSVRQRVQTLGRLLRRHSVDGSEEKHSVMHVIYVRDTVDDAIYGQEDWEEASGRERNAFYHYLPPEEPERRDGPPRRPRPVDTDVPADALMPGGDYPGRHAGDEFTVDTQGNVRTVDGDEVNAPPHLWEDIISIKGNAGHFVVTPTKHHVLVRIRQGEEWSTRFVTALASPLEVGVPDQHSGYRGPTDAAGGEYVIKRSASGPRIARPLPSGRGLQFAKRGPAAQTVIDRVARIQPVDRPISKFRVNRLGHAIAQLGGTWVLLGTEGKDIEF